MTLLKRLWPWRRTADSVAADLKACRIITAKQEKRRDGFLTKSMRHIPVLIGVCQPSSLPDARSCLRHVEDGGVGRAESGRRSAGSAGAISIGSTMNVFLSLIHI